MDEQAVTWRTVGQRLDRMGRGAKNQLARALKMDPSYLRRKLDSNAELTVSQARTVNEFIDGSAEPADNLARSATGEAKRIPVYGYAAAGGEDLVAFNTGNVLDYIEPPMGLSLRGDYFVVRTIGSSMEPRIFAGEPLIVQHNMPPARGQDVLIEFSDGSAVIKTYRGQRDGTVFAEQYNPAQEMRYPASSVKALHGVFCRL